MTFALPVVLWLAAIPFVLLLCDVAGGAVSDAWPRVRRLWAGPSGLAASDVTPSRRRWFLWFGLVLVIVAAARPQWGKIQEETFDQSREVLLALDLSRSMLAEDVKPSRLARAKLLIESLLDKLKGERVGLILFSGTAFLQSPLSPDYEVLREFLPEVGPDYLPEGGTDFDKLLQTALDSFSNDGGADRFLIVLSDGESQTNDWRGRIEKMNQRNIRVITLGIGTEEGAVMPAEGGGFVKDDRGAVVLSRLQPQTLRDLARLTNGTYANAATWVDLAKLINDTVDRAAKGAFSKRSEIRMKERYQWFLAAGLFLLALSYWREFPVQPRVRDLRRRPGGGTPAAAALVVLCASIALAPPARAAATLTSPPVSPPTAPQAEESSREATELSGLARSLSEQPSLSAADAARFANATIDFGEQQRQTGKPIPPTVLQDGIASVDLGERTDSKAADWEEMRRKLEDLAKPPEPQKQDKKDDKKKDEEKKDQQQQQQGSGQDQKQQDQKEKQDPSSQQQDKKDQEKRSGQKAFDDPKEQQQQQQDQQQQQQDDSDQQQQEKKNMQLVGGEQPDNKELKETPELVVPLQKLDKVKQQDSPARLFQILQNEEPKPKEKKGKDW